MILKSLEAVSSALEASLTRKKWRYELIEHFSSADAWTAEVLEMLMQLAYELAQRVLQGEVRVDMQQRMLMLLGRWLIRDSACLATAMA